MALSASSELPAVGALVAELCLAPDVTAACATTARCLRDAGHPLTSLYLEQGGRLRCHAVHGYGQIFDGILPGVGNIGLAFIEDRIVEAGHVQDDDAYRAAAEGVQHEIALPLRVAGRCVGVLNVESRTTQAAGTRELLEAAAQALSRRLAELGGPPPESSSQQLVRHATELAAAPDLSGLAEVLLEAATDISALECGLLLLGSPPRAVAQRGPAAQQLAALPPAALEQVAAWVQAGGSSRTSGEPADAAALQQVLAQAGMTTFVLVPLTIGSERLGVLMVGDATGRKVAPTVVESLELVGALAAADVRSLRSAQQLHKQARTDDLTGLPHRRSFTEALRDAVTVRTPGTHLAVVLLDLDGFKQVNDTHGHPAGDALLIACAQALAGALRTSSSELFRLGGDEFASVLLLDHPEDLRAVCDRLLHAVRGAGATVSVGGVVVRAGQDEQDVVAAADAELYAAKRSGRDRACVRI